MSIRGERRTAGFDASSPGPRRAGGSGRKVVSYEEFLRRKRGSGRPSSSWSRRIGARELWGMGTPVTSGGTPNRDRRLRRNEKLSPEIIIKPFSKRRNADVFAVEEARRPFLKTGRKESTRRRLILGLMLIASLVTLAWVYLFSGLVSVRNLLVLGVDRLDPACIKSLSGIQEGTNLLRVDTEKAERSILTDPRVRDVKVYRSFPDTVVIRLSERKPLVFMPQNGLFYLVDREGMVFDYSEGRPAEAVELRLAPSPVLYAGKRLEELDVKEVLEVLAGSPRLAAMAEKAGKDERGVYLECDGVRVILGDAHELGRKESIALGSLKTASAMGTKLDYVDVRLPDHPVWKPRY